MSRRPASCFWEQAFAGLAAAVLSSCGGGSKEAPAPQPAAPAETAAAAEPSPSPAVDADAPPVAASNTPPPASPSPAPAAAPADTAPPPPAAVPDPNAKPVNKPADALQWMQDGEARRADYQRRLKESEANLAIANASVADWERTVLAFKNPLRPRPQLSPEDAQAIAGMDGGARVHWAEGRLEEARASRDAVQKALGDLKANPPIN